MIVTARRGPDSRDRRHLTDLSDERSEIHPCTFKLANTIRISLHDAPNYPGCPFGRTMARPYTVPLDENNIALIA